MEIVKDKIKLEKLCPMAEKMFDDLVKAVVDIETENLALDSDLHSDLEKFLVENWSEQGNLWGINLYPQAFGTDNFIEFNSMINLKPAYGNRTRGVENIEIQKKIIEIVNKKVEQ